MNCMNMHLLKKIVLPGSELLILRILIEVTRRVVKSKQIGILQCACSNFDSLRISRSISVYGVCGVMV